MADNIPVDPGTDAGAVAVATRTLVVNGATGIQVPYGLLGWESSGAFVAVDATHPLPVGLAGGVAVTNFPAVQAVSQSDVWAISGTVGLAGALPAGANQIGHVITDTGSTTAITGLVKVDLSNTGANTTPILVTQASAGGDSIYSVISSGSANQDAAAIKSGAGQVFGYAMFNTTSSARYVKFYNTAAPTSASTPIVRVYLPPTGGANVSIPDGIAFGAAIGIRITTASADNDTGACAAGDVLANIWYK